MTDRPKKANLLFMKTSILLPFVYLDISPTHGIIGGAIQMNLQPAF